MNELLQIQRENIKHKIKNNLLIKVNYPKVKFAYYDKESGCYFNENGEMLKDLNKH